MGSVTFELSKAVGFPDLYDGVVTANAEGEYVVVYFFCLLLRCLGVGG